MLKQKHLLAAGAAMALASLSSSAFAVSNPGFEDGKFGDWQTIGQVGLFGQFKGSIDPSEPVTQAIAFTNRFASQTKNAATSSLAADNFFGADLAAALPGASLFDGSGIKQTFSLTQAATITFDWALGNRKSEPSGNDAVFAVLDSVFYLLTDLNSAIFTRSGSDKYRFTDYTTFASLPELLAGEHTLAFGAINVGSGTGRSALLLDNVTVTLSPLVVVDDDPPTDDGDPKPEPNPNPIPEPVTAGLAMMGLGALAIATRRRRAAA